MAEFDTPLTLVTPHTSGRKVRDAEWLLSGHNRFSATKHPVAPYTGRIDGVYGPHAAGATLHAQYLLGYKNPSTVFGQQLYKYLLDTTLPAEMQTLRAVRLKELDKPAKEKALEVAISFIGSNESGRYGSCNTFGAWYGENCVNWCAIFVSYCISHASVQWKEAYVPNIVHMASIGQMYMSLTYDPQPGDLVAYTFNPNDPNGHVEFYEANIDGNSFTAVGGNTGYTRNGVRYVGVARSTRYRYQVSHFIRLTLPKVGP